MNMFYDETKIYIIGCNNRQNQYKFWDYDRQSRRLEIIRNAIPSLFDILNIHPKFFCNILSKIYLHLSRYFYGHELF